MCGRRSEPAYVEDMIQSCERILMYARGNSDADLIDADMAYWDAILRQLIVLGEAAKYIGETSRVRWCRIPWIEIAGMRDKIVHYYQGIDDELVLGAIKTSIPAVLPQLRHMLAELRDEA
ncbi:MAG: DUF86 domain-containing protein [Coriobacteriia bacterium]|nr:DUF86 domain-containing protein [Coriobacteriia bacterium]